MPGYPFAAINCARPHPDQKDQTIDASVFIKVANPSQEFAMFEPICLEISVKGCSSDFDLIDDDTDEWIILGVVEHCFGVFYRLLVAYRHPAHALQQP